MFRLPSYQELSYEQDNIMNLPLTGHHVVVGPPGSGKTVMALYRARMYAKSSKTVNLAVFNNTLSQYLGQAINEFQLGAAASTMQSWFSSWYLENFKRWAPKRGDNRYEFDWAQILEQVVKARNRIEKIDALILDEGQDFPRDFYLVIGQIAKNVTVFADENQRIHDSKNSTIREIQNYLNTSSKEVLTTNYRNTREIAEFASHFYADVESGQPLLPDKRGERPKLYTGKAREEQLTLISNYTKGFPKHQIGILLKDSTTQDKYETLLRAKLRGINVQNYTYRNRQSLDFSKPGIFLLNYQSAKGMEFDAVFLPELQELRTDEDVTTRKMRFYVLSTRARQSLFLMDQNSSTPIQIQHVPSELYHHPVSTQ
jgi:DNA helicase IV